MTLLKAKFNKLSLFLIIFFLGLKQCESGHIYSWDVQLEYQNAGDVRYLTLFFSLESGLPSGNEILLEFPKEVTTGAQTTSCLLGPIGYNATGGCQVSATAKLVSVTTSILLNPNDWYQLRIELTNQNNQVVGYQGLIAMTTQKPGTNKIKYDSNPAFANYQFAYKALTTTEVVQGNPAGVTDKLRTAFGQTNEYYFDISPKVSVVGGSLWTVELLSTDFSFTSTCLSQGITCAVGESNCENITLLLGTCSIESGGKRLFFNSNDDIVASKKFRIKASIRNPSYKVDPVNYIVQSESKLTRILFEKVTLTNKLSVSDLTIVAPTLKFLWGVPSSDGTSNSRCKVGFYKSGTKINVFNDFVLEFKVPVTPALQNLKLSFEIPSSNFAVMKSSIMTNLPTFPSKALKISITSNAIEVWNVGPLTDISSTIYVLRGRCYFSSSTSTAAANFGAVKVEALNSAGSVISTMGLSTGAPYTPITNYEYIGGTRTLSTDDYHTDANALKYGYIFVSSKLGTSDFVLNDISPLLTDGTSTSIRPGIPLSTSDKLRALVITINPGPEHICCKGGASNLCEQNTDVSACGTSTSFVIMLGMIVNSDIINISTTSGLGVQLLDGFWLTSSLAVSPSCPTATTAYTQYGRPSSCNSNILNDWVNDATNKVGHLKLQYVGTSPTNIVRKQSSTLYPAALVIKEVSSGVGLYNSGKEKSSQLYGGQQVLDMIICFSYVAGAGATETGLLTASQSLINTFVIENSVEANLKVRLVNYLRQESASINYVVPVFIRIFGYLSGSSSGTTLSLFLDDHFDISTFTEGNCISSVSGVTCTTYSSSKVSYQNVNFRQRVDLMGANPQAGTTNFDHVIPVKAKEVAFAATPNTFHIDLGILGVDSTDSRFLSVKTIFRIYGYAWGGNRAYTYSNSGSATVKNAITVGTTRAQTQHNTANCGSQTAASLPVSDAAFDPGYIYASGMDIKTETASSCLGSKSAADVLNTGVLLSHRSMDLIGAAEVKWAAADNLLCKKYSFANSDASSKSIGVLCVLSISLSGSNDLTTTGSKITVSTFTVPWKWGSQISLAALDLHMSYSLVGENAAYYAHPAFSDASGNFATACTSSDWSAISRNTKQQQVKFTFSPSSGVELTIGSSDSILIKAIGTNLGSSGWTEISCRVELSTSTPMGCSVTAQVFTLTPSSDPIKVSLAKNTQSIYYRGNQDTSTVVEKTAYLEIWYKPSGGTAVKIDSCDQAQPKKILASSTEDVATLSLGDPIFVLSKTARSSFYFSFGVSGSSRLLWKDTVFEFTLGWLGDKLSEVSANLHCYIRNGNGMAFGFKELDLTAPASPKVTLGEDTSLGSYIFNCNGALSPSLATTGNLTFVWKDATNTLGSLKTEAAKSVPAATALSDAKADLSVSFENKLWNSPSFESTYIFNITPKNNNYTVMGRIYIDFPIDLPPRGNRVGSPFCSVDDLSAFCEFIEERKLSIWLPKDLINKPPSPYQISVYRIAQPNSITTYKKIAISLDQDASPSNGVSEWGFVEDITPSAAAIKPISITSLLVSSKFTRNSADISVSVALPEGSVVKDAIFYLQFPSYWDDILFLNSNMNCVFFRESDSANTNLLQNFTFLKDRKLMFYTALDSESAKSNIYIFKIINFPTPHHPTLPAPSWITFFQSLDKKTVLSSTSAGSINASVSFFDHNLLKQNPVWFTKSGTGIRNQIGSGNLDVYLGTYRSSVFLGFLKDSEVSNSTYDVSLIGDSATKVYLWPPLPKVQFGLKEQNILIAGKTGTPPGRYLLSFAKTGDTGSISTLVPTLPVVLRADPCQVNPNLQSTKVPAGGTSLPIVFDFSRCMPATDIEIKANLSSTEKYNVSFAKDDLYALVTSQKLTFSDFSDTRISFVVYSNNLTTEPGKQTTITYTVSGLEKASYSDPLSTRVDIIDNTPFNAPPVVQSFTATPAAGKVTLSITCSATGNYFWAIGINKRTSNLTLDYIKSRTIDVRRNLVPRDPNDVDWLVMGYGDQSEAKESLIEILGVRAGGLYNATAYCTNQLYASSPKTDLLGGWNQTDNGARTVRVALNFSAPVGESALNQIACGFCNLLAIPYPQVRTQNGTFCQNKRLLQNSTNATNTTNTSSNTPTASNSTIYSWFILPDFSAATATTQNLVKELYDRPNFVDLLVSRSGVNITSLGGQITKAGMEIAPLAPNVGALTNVTSLIYGNTWIKFTLGIQQRAGFILVGAGLNGTLTPNAQQLRAGLDGNNTALNASMKLYSPNKTVDFNFTGLSNNTLFKLYMMSSSDNPGPDAIYSEVNYIYAKTLDPNGGAILHLAALILTLLIILF